MAADFLRISTFIPLARRSCILDGLFKHPSSRVLSALVRLLETLTLSAGRWEAVPWIKASAYGLFGLPVPWQLPNGEIDEGFRTSESGQMLFNRREHLQQNAAVKIMLDIDVAKFEHGSSVPPNAKAYMCFVPGGAVMLKVHGHQLYWGIKLVEQWLLSLNTHGKSIDKAQLLAAPGSGTGMRTCWSGCGSSTRTPG